jgi:hypothetical protein
VNLQAITQVSFCGTTKYKVVAGACEGRREIRLLAYPGLGGARIGGTAITRITAAVEFANLPIISLRLAQVRIKILAEARINRDKKRSSFQQLRVI